MSVWKTFRFPAFFSLLISTASERMLSPIAFRLASVRDRPDVLSVWYGHIRVRYKNGWQLITPPPAPPHLRRPALRPALLQPARLRV